MAGLLATLRAQIQDRLEADAYFADIPVFTEETGDVENQIARALGTLTETGGKIGTCAVVLTARADVRESGLPGPYLDPVYLLVHIEESVLVNQSAQGTQKACSDVAERVMALLHRWTPDGRARPMLCGDGGIQPADPQFGDRAYDVTVRTAGGFDPELSQVATPTADPAAGAAPQTVELACATAGAAIFYTLDGKFPSPTAGTLYSAPIEVATAATLKAAAYLAGYLNSDVLVARFT